MIADLLDFVRTTIDGANASEAKVDPGGDVARTAQHFAPAGDDSHPLRGDLVVLVEADGRQHAVGYVDEKNAGVAEPGEKRIYSRDAGGTVAAVVWLKADGSIVIDNGSGAFELAPNGDVTINGVTIDVAGNVSAPGEVTARSMAAPVNLSTHIHPDMLGSTGSPTPGT